VKNYPGCECVAELLPSGDDRAYCSKCGKEYVRARTEVHTSPEQQKPETD
jgi:hypothetical protein